MKKVKMFISAAIIFAVVGSALAFKAKTNPNLYTCNPASLTCEIAAFSDFTAIQEIQNPGNLYKPNTGLHCSIPGKLTDPCPIYNGRVWTNE